MVLGAAGAALLMKWRFGRHVAFARQRSAYVLIVQLAFESVDDKSKFIALWSELADYCRESEPNTLSYELAESDESNGKSVLIYERYVCKSDLRSVHDTSPLKVALDGKLAAAGVKITEAKFSTFIESNVGYMVH